MSLQLRILLTWFHIQQIPKKIFDDGFRFVSFDIKSIFTNIPISDCFSASGTSQIRCKAHNGIQAANYF